MGGGRQGGWKMAILLPQSLRCWDHGCPLSYLDFITFIYFTDPYIKCVCVHMGAGAHAGQMRASDPWVGVMRGYGLLLESSHQPTPCPYLGYQVTLPCFLGYEASTKSSSQMKSVCLCSHLTQGSSLCTEGVVQTLETGTGVWNVFQSA